MKRGGNTQAKMNNGHNGCSKTLKRELTLGLGLISKKVTGIMLCSCIVTSSLAHQAVNDSTSTDDHSCEFKARQLIVPSALIAIGTAGVYSEWFNSLNHDVKDGMERWRKDKYCKADDYLQYLPVAANLGLGLTGMKARHPLRERIACTATAYLAMGIMVNVTKYTVREKRPDSGTRNSFPSGHTATAFTGAELVRKEYGNIPGLCAYTLATGVAVMRLYNNRHWLNDVLAGAGIGVLSAKIGFWLLPWEKRLLGWNDSNMNIIVLPGIGAKGKQTHVDVCVTF